MRLIVLLLLPYMILSSCQPIAKRYHQLVFKQQEDIVLTGANYGPFSSVQWVGNDKKQFVCYDFNLCRLYRFDFAKRQLIDSMNLLPVQGMYNHRAQVGAIHYVNPDSIYILLNPVYRTTKRYYHDSSIVLINSKREIKGLFSFKGAPVFSEENPPIGKTSMQLLFANYFKDKTPLLVHQQRMYANFSIHVKMEPGDSLYANYQQPVVGSFDLSQTKPIYAAESLYRYPWPLGNVLTTEYKLSSLTPGFEDELLMSYPMTPNVIRYNPTYKTRQLLAMPSIIFDTVQRPDTFKHVKVDNNSRRLVDRHLPFYGLVRYDEYRDAYIRKVIYPCTVGATPSQISTIHHGAIYRDRKTGILAEGLLPDRFNFHNCLIDELGLLSFNYQRSKEKENTIVLTRYTYQTKPTSKTRLRKSIEKRINASPNPEQSIGITNYITEQTRLKPTNQMVVLMPMFSSCPSTFKKSCNYIKQVKDSLRGRSVYFLFMDGKNAEFNAVQQEYGFTDQDTMILCELNKRHKHYMHFFLDPRIIVYDQGKIIQDKNLGLREIHQLPQIVRDYVQRKPTKEIPE
jgi:hypothetical protein